MAWNTLLLILGLLVTTQASGGTEGMPSMKMIKPKKVHSVPTIQAGEDLLEQRGYGDDEPKVRMMNLMMVGGSGYEGMDMSAGSSSPDQSHAAHVPIPAEGQSARYDFTSSVAPNPSTIGVNTLTIDVQNKRDKKPAAGLRLTAQVYMTTMDMGTQKPKVLEIAPGRYQVKAVFSMRGSWAVNILLPNNAQKTFLFEVRAER